MGSTPETIFYQGERDEMSVKIDEIFIKKSTFNIYATLTWGAAEIERRQKVRCQDEIKYYIHSIVLHILNSLYLLSKYWRTVRADSASFRLRRMEREEKHR